MTTTHIADWRLDSDHWKSEWEMFLLGKTLAWKQKIQAMGQPVSEGAAVAKWWPPDLEWLMRSGVKRDIEFYAPKLAQRFEEVVTSPAPAIVVSGESDEIPWIEAVLDLFMSDSDGPGGAKRVLFLEPQRKAWAREPFFESAQLLKELWPEAAHLFSALVSRVVFVAGQGLQSATDHTSMGAIFLGPRKSWGAVKFAELMVHESGHLHLDIKNSLVQFLDNPEEFGSSPVKKSLRPMRQVLQAVFVLKRMCAFLERAREREELREDAEASLALYAPRLEFGLATMERDAKWTEEGRKLFESLRG